MTNERAGRARLDAGAWEFWIDRGGTFSDVIGVAPDGRIRCAKLLSGLSEPDAVRQLLEAAGSIRARAALPACRIRLGTTLATNALLERRGEAFAWVANRGFGDLLRIGTQARPELFRLDSRRPEPLPAAVVEVDGRLDAQGAELEPLDLAEARADFERLRSRGIRALAISLLHAWKNPAHENALAVLARELGFAHVVTSAEISGEIGLLARAETTCADAYLTPLLQRHVASLAAALPGSKLRFLQSSGGLCDGARFRGPAALLSGPAGGAAGAARVAELAGAALAIGFDMGGTSTDVCLIRDGEVERDASCELAGLRVSSPALRIHSVAAGGGSLCRFDGFRMSVGPESAGASPGPLCYGDPRARELTITDLNLALGRLPADRFPFALAREPVERALAAQARELAAAGRALPADAIASGFLEIANAAMAEAIAVVTVARGIDPRDCALVGFGGAAGQHLCAVARRLGIRRALVHPLAGLLSAYGIGAAPESWDGQRDAGRARLAAGPRALAREVLAHFDSLERAGRASIARESAAAEPIAERWLDLRYVGTEAALGVREPADGDWLAAFERAHRERFGYARSGRAVEICVARVRLLAARAELPEPAPAVDTGPAPAPLRRARVCCDGSWHADAPVYAREDLPAGFELAGPALVIDAASTLVLDPGWRLRVRADGVIDAGDFAGATPRALASGAPDPVRLEVFANRFQSIAEQMGAVLRNTSVSTNIKERLDFSCALFDAEGALVANAPHIPVHLGAMGETVRAVRERFADLEPGDAIVTNDPAAGGSHLPDVTLVTPVFAGQAEGRAPDYFVACRGHHADVGGISPGSMPALSRSLDDEGVLIPPVRVVRRGELFDAELRKRLTRAPHPARNPGDNLAELEAMCAANRCGAGLLGGFASEVGADAVARAMRELQALAAGLVARAATRLPQGERVFQDALDDGTRIRVRVRIAGGRIAIDFAGTGPASAGNLNAPRAVTQAAVLYALRTQIAERVPLNAGFLAPVEISIPPGSLLDPPPGAAVVGGNVETSQRVVDVLLGALGAAAASQGTMNNLAFGDARFGYYETLGGGCGAGPGFDGASGQHSHMTNTRVTDPELLELRYPVRLREFSLRRGSGGAGRRRGGDGLVRRIEFLAPLAVTILSQRRSAQPFGLDGGSPGAAGRNALVCRDGRRLELAGIAAFEVAPGDTLVIETPGGGGFGATGDSR
jgi:5-oxoprolinase (ATP-hydrolysing)